MPIYSWSRIPAFLIFALPIAISIGLVKFFNLLVVGNIQSAKISPSLIADGIFVSHTVASFQYVLGILMVLSLGTFAIGGLFLAHLARRIGVGPFGSLIVLLGVGAGAGVILALNEDVLDKNTTYAALVPPALQALGVEDQVREIVRYGRGTMIAVGAYIVSAFAIIVWPPGQSTVSPDEIYLRSKLLRLCTYIGAAALLGSVLFIGALVGLPSSLIECPKIHLAAVEGLGAKLGTYWGTWVTLILLSGYAPAQWYLSQVARSVAKHEFETTAQSEVNQSMPERYYDDWLEREKLNLSPSQIIGQATTILGPIIAGPLGALLTHFASL